MRSVWSGCGTTSDFETLCTMWGIFYAASYSWRRIRVISRVQVTSTAHMFCRRKQDVCASSLQSVLMHHWREAGNESVKMLNTVDIVPLFHEGGSHLDMDSVCRWGLSPVSRPRILRWCCRWLCRPPVFAESLHRRSPNTEIDRNAHVNVAGNTITYLLMRSQLFTCNRSFVFENGASTGYVNVDSNWWFKYFPQLKLLHMAPLILVA